MLFPSSLTYLALHADCAAAWIQGRPTEAHALCALLKRWSLEDVHNWIEQPTVLSPSTSFSLSLDVVHDFPFICLAIHFSDSGTAAGEVWRQDHQSVICLEEGLS